MILFLINRRQHSKTSLGGVQYEVTVGMPSFRFPPSGFGISTRLTGDGVYFPLRILSVSSRLCSFSHGSVASMVIPSTPGAPLFAFTLL